MQALHDHFGADDDDDDADGGGVDGDKQIWQVGFCEGGLRKVHFLQDHDIVAVGSRLRERELGVFLGFMAILGRAMLSDLEVVI